MTSNQTTCPPTPDELDNVPTASDWLKRNWRMALKRDPFEATQDTAILHRYCQANLPDHINQMKEKKARQNG